MSFFFNDTATTEIYTLSLHDALPIYQQLADRRGDLVHRAGLVPPARGLLRRGRLQLGRRALDVAHRGAHLAAQVDRKSTRLNSSHANLSYAVFCLKKKNRRTGRDDRQ